MPFVSLHGRAFGFDSDNGAVIQNGVIRNALAKKTITSAQVLALFATPIQIVAAPGAGLALILNRLVIYKAAGTAYAGVAAGEDLVAKYTNAAGAQASSVIETTGFLDQATAQTRYAGPPGAVTTAAADVTPVANAALVLHLLVGEIITGTSDLIVWTYYDVLPTVLTV
jgi:hypothetical protein